MMVKTREDIEKRWAQLDAKDGSGLALVSFAQVYGQLAVQLSEAYEELFAVMQKIDQLRRECEMQMCTTIGAVRSWELADILVNASRKRAAEDNATGQGRQQGPAPGHVSCSGREAD